MILGPIYIICVIFIGHLLVPIRTIKMHGTCIKITVNVFYNRPVGRLEVHQKTQFLLPGSQKVQ